MTDQERPVEERNELLDDLVAAATAVADPEESKQQPAVDEQPESAAQSAAPVRSSATIIRAGVMRFTVDPDLGDR